MSVLFVVAALVTGGGQASFVAHGPAGMRIEGSTDAVKVSESDGFVTVSVTLAALKTGIELRDKHLRDDLETEKFPEAVLRVKCSGLDGAGGTADGELTLHGQTHPVRFTWKASHTASGLDVEGTLPIDARAFGIVIPSYLGITVKPDVETRATLHLSP